MNDTIRYWRFSVLTWDGDTEYLDPDGNPATFCEPELWRGTDADAHIEADRRADLYEAKWGGIERITLEPRP